MLTQHEDTTANDQRQLPVPSQDATWGELAASVFPNSHAMTREERREFDALFWSEMESLASTPERPE